MSQGFGMGHVAAGILPPADPHAIVAEIAAERRRNTRRFRITFVVTWILLVGGLVGFLFVSGKIDTAFLAKWGGHILGCVATTTFAPIRSIVIAICFAIAGSLARL